MGSREDKDSREKIGKKGKMGERRIEGFGVEIKGKSSEF